MFLKRVVAAALVLAALSVFAGDAVKTPATQETVKGPHTAVFALPGLKDQAVVKQANAALAKEQGVLVTKADAEAGKFMVTYEPAKTTPEALGKALATVSPDAKFEKVQPADPAAAKHDCSKCPSKATCSGHK